MWREHAPTGEDGWFFIADFKRGILTPPFKFRKMNILQISETSI